VDATLEAHARRELAARRRREAAEAERAAAETAESREPRSGESAGARPPETARPTLEGEQFQKRQLQKELALLRGDGNVLRHVDVAVLDELEATHREAMARITAERSRRMAELMRKEKDTTICVVCQEEKKSVLLLPCRHLCLCGACARRDELLQCPLCREDIAQRVDVFH
jgi:hypothetical protein